MKYARQITVDLISLGQEFSLGVFKIEVVNNSLLNQTVRPYPSSCTQPNSRLEVIGIYKLGDVGISSNLIGLLSLDNGY